MFGNFDIGPTTLRLKAGKHSIFWGDVAFNANHSVAYSQMPNDSRKSLASPGVEAKETVLPLNQLSGQLQITDTLAVAGQYFLDWKPNRLPEGGTYYGAADFLFYGPDKFSLSPALTVRRARCGRARQARQLGRQRQVVAELDRRHARRLLPQVRRAPAVVCTAGRAPRRPASIAWSTQRTPSCTASA